MRGSRISPKVGFSAVDVVLIGMTFIWGVNFSVVKTALIEISPLSFNSVRFGLASLFILVLLWIFERNLVFLMEDLGRLVLLGLIGNTVHQLCFIYGLARTTVSDSSLIFATTPIFVGLLSSIFGVERVERKVCNSVALSFIGIFLIVLGSGKSPTLTDESLIGGILILASIVVVLAWLFLSEMMTLLQVLGVVLVFASLYLARRPLMVESSERHQKR